MRIQQIPILRYRPTVAFALFVTFLAILVIGGGGSRADLMGQVVVRAGSWGLLIVAILIYSRPRLRDARPVAFFLIGAVVLASIQLIPLPPSWWLALPGHAVFAEAAAASEQSQPWRPWSIVPGATVNALSSLVVPLAALVLVTSMREEERSWLPAVLLGFIATATLIGLLQFAGMGFNNPFLNETPGEVAGVFANRNHFAVLLAMGCALAPVWAFLDTHRLSWRGPVAVGLVALFVLTILVSGSRTGVALGGAGLAMGLLIVAKRMRGTLRRAPRWAFPAAIAGSLGLVSILVLASFLAGRAVSINRVLSTDVGQDMRSRGLPTVFAMIRDYFPWGAGLGGFDPLFRLHEPFALLKPTYFNHAHNDWLEVVLDTGILGGLLLAAAVLWWGYASFHAWKRDAMTPKLGSAILLLLLVASAFDYPARTPIMMAIIVLAGVWLGRANEPAGAALPSDDEHL